MVWKFDKQYFLACFFVMFRWRKTRPTGVTKQDLARGQVLLAALGSEKRTPTYTTREMQQMGVHGRRASVGYESSKWQITHSLGHPLLRTNGASPWAHCRTTKQRCPTEAVYLAKTRRDKQCPARITAHDLGLHQRHSGTLYAAGKFLELQEMRTHDCEDQISSTHPSTWPSYNSNKRPWVALVPSTHEPKIPMYEFFGLELRL